jgi:hypothetical protein
MLANVVLRIVKFLETFVAPCVALAPFIFQLLVSLKYRHLLTFVLLFLVWLTTVMWNALHLSSLSYYTFKAVMNDVLERFPDNLLRRVDLSTYVGTDELMDMVPEMAVQRPILELVKSQRRAGDLYIVEVHPSAKAYLPGGQSYRTIMWASSFVFIPPVKNYINRFLVLHEIGHSGAQSGGIMTEVMVMRSSYIGLLLVIAPQIHWTLLSAALFGIAVLHAMEYWHVNIQDKQRLAHLTSEIYADKFACEHLNEHDLQRLRECVERGMFSPDPKLPDADNRIRLSALADQVNKNFTPWIGENVGSLLQKAIVIGALALGYSRAPSTGLTVVVGIVMVLMYMITRIQISEERRLRFLIDRRINSEPETK